MAKKQKRSVSKTTSSVTSTNQSNGSFTRSSSTDFNPDYSDIISDLKRIGILAGSFFTILIVLSFFLR